jgi:acetylglutamate kinase
MTVATPLTIKLGGVAGAYQASLEVIARDAEASCVVVHGGGPELADWQRRLGLEPKVQDGLRVTDLETLEVAVAVLAGLVNTRLVAAFAAAGRPAIGLSGADADLLTLERADASLGEVGHPIAANVAVLQLLTNAGLLPVVSSIGQDADGSLLNVNADAVAGAIAAARGGRLLLCSDVEGVRRDGHVVAALTTAEAAEMLASGDAQAGMIPKLAAAIVAARAGCAIAILDGRSPETLSAALAGEAVGTVIQADVEAEVSA